MLAEYLRRALEGEYDDLEIIQLWLHWWGSGHAITIVSINGKYYVIDAQTGETRGPYDSLQDAVNGAWDIMKQRYNIDKDDLWFPWHRWFDPGDRPWNEPAPWYHNPDIYEDLKDNHDIDPDDFIPPDDNPHLDD